MFPARNWSWMANGQAYTSPIGIDQAHHPARAAQVQARQRARRSPSPDRWKNESPVSTRSPRATSQS